MEKFVVVECENSSFLNRVKKRNRQIECYLTTFGDLEKGAKRALKADYTGLSFEFEATNPPSEALVERVKSKGLKLQFWTVDTVQEIEKALTYRPYTIQSDNLIER